MVFLRPGIVGRGHLRLLSPPGRFGSDGAYLVVVDGDRRATARRVPLHERFEVFVDDVGMVRCDHALDFRTSRVLRLHYRMEQS